MACGNLLVTWFLFDSKGLYLLKATSILQVADSKSGTHKDGIGQEKSRSFERLSRNIRNPEGALWGRSRPPEREDGANAYSE